MSQLQQRPAFHTASMILITKTFVTLLYSTLMPLTMQAPYISSKSRLYNNMSPWHNFISQLKSILWALNYMLRKNLIPSMTKEISCANIFLLKFASSFQSRLQWLTSQSFSERKITGNIIKCFVCAVDLMDGEMTICFHCRSLTGGTRKTRHAQ